MKKILFSLIISTIVATLVWSQEKPKVKKETYKINDEGFNDAWKALKKGNKNFRKKKVGSYHLAYQNYKIACNYNQDNAALAYRMGVSCVKYSKKAEALKYIKLAYELNPFITSDINFWLARAYHLNYKFKEAIDEYEVYMASLSESKLRKKKRLLNKYIDECKNGIKLIENPVRVLIENLGPDINTEYPEYSPVFAAYDSIVFFTSRRPDTRGKRRNNISNQYYEDIYYTSFKEGKWFPAANIGKPLNSKGNDAVVAISPNGKEMLIYRGSKKNGNILRSKYKEGSEKWSRPKSIISKINSKKYRETTLSFSRDSMKVYFVSYRKKGHGLKDIYFCKRKSSSNSGWTKSSNIGNPINSAYDEEAVFIAQNDSVLYFSSKGHNSMGGYDIFRSILLPDGRWAEPQNLGYPINTPDDDIFFSLSLDNRTGYYCTKDENGYGDLDLCSFVLLGPPKPMEQGNDDELIAWVKTPIKEIFMEEPVFIKTMLLTVVKGIVTDAHSGKPLAATVEIIDNSTNTPVQTIGTNGETGAFQIMLPSGKNYGMSVNAEGYMFHSENFDIPSSSQFQEINKDIQLLPIDPGSKVVLRNVFFDTGKATLRPESFPELNRLAQICILYPSVVIEISGHTDNRGKDQMNNKLSENRAKSVVEYLVSVGVKSSNLVAKGYGKKQPVATNNTEEGRQLNRRVEAKILSK